MSDLARVDGRASGWRRLAARALPLVLVAVAPLCAAQAPRPDAPSLAVPTLGKLFPTHPVSISFGPPVPAWIAMFFACLLAIAFVFLAALAVAVLVSALAPVPGTSLVKLLAVAGWRKLLAVLLVFPVLEEIAFRLVLVWWLSRCVLEVGLIAAFWWSLAFFVLAHILDVIADPARILDAINIGTFNTIMFLMAYFKGGFPVWAILVFFILLHLAYNGLVLLFKCLPVAGVFLLRGLRAAGLFIAAIVYWYGMGELAAYWSW